jgi:CheY-like chemotaxis protein
VRVAFNRGDNRQTSAEAVLPFGVSAAAPALERDGHIWRSMDLGGKMAARRRRRTPVVALTADAMAHQAAEYRAVGTDGYIAMPVEFARLCQVLEAALSHPSGEVVSAAV